MLTPTSTYFLLAALLTLITAATLAETPVLVLVNILVLGKLIINIVQPIISSAGTPPSDLYGTVAPLITLAVVSGVTRYFINAGEHAVTTSRSNANLLQATSEVGQVISQLLDQEELLNRAVEMILTRFKHYHVQVFLVNDTHDQAVLVASTGDVGKQLLSRGHQLSVGSQSVIGQVVLRSAPVLVNDVSRDPVYYRNELLLNTRAELAVPIRDGNQTIGALDIQSLNVNAFSRTDLQALQIMADLLATAIRNARLFKQQSETVRENERLLRDSEANLREIQRLNQQLTRIAWQNYHTEGGAVTGVTLERDQIQPTNDWSESLMRAGQEGQVVEGDEGEDGNPKTVAVPMILRGEVIGAIEVEAGKENTPETVEMMQAVAQRLALSLENARLYEATLQAAAQEQRINDDLEVFREELADGRRHRRINGQPHDAPEPPLAHSIFDRLKKVFRFQLLDGNLGIPRDPERMGLEDLHSRKERPHIRRDELLEKKKGARPLVTRLRGGAELEKPGKGRRQLDPGESLHPCGVADHQGEVQAHVGNVGKRPTGIHGQRREDRKDDLLEVPVSLCPLPGRERGILDDADPRLFEQRQELLETPSRLLHQLV